MGELWEKGPEAIKIGDPATDYTQINPFTDAQWANLGNEQNFWKQQLTSGNYGLEQMFGPGGYWNKLYGLTMEPTSQLAQGLQDQYKGLLNKSMGQAAGQAADLNSLYSGNTQQIFAEQGGQAAKDMYSQTLAAQLGLLGNLGGQAMGILGGREQMAGNLYGNILGQRTQMAEPTFAGQQYYVDPGGPGFLQNLLANLIPAGVGAAMGGLGGGAAPAAAAAPGYGGLFSSAPPGANPYTPYTAPASNSAPWWGQSPYGGFPQMYGWKPDYNQTLLRGGM